LPNGNFRDLGAYGNTDHASKSPSLYVLTNRPNGGELWPASQTFSIRWRSHDFNDTVTIDLLDGTTGAIAATIAADTPNDGEFEWTIPAGFTPGNYRVQVTRTGDGTSDLSDGTFTITGPVHTYYVNDDAFAVGDWTTAVGNDANDGLSSNTPKRSIRAILDAYDLEPGDVIRVDAGTYVLTANIVIGAQDSGVVIQGFDNGSFDRESNPNGTAPLLSTSYSPRKHFGGKLCVPTRGRRQRHALASRHHRRRMGHRGVDQCG
jgi:hypothetical protein